MLLERLYEQAHADPLRPGFRRIFRNVQVCIVLSNFVDEMMFFVDEMMKKSEACVTFRLSSSQVMQMPRALGRPRGRPGSRGGSE